MNRKAKKPTVMQVISAVIAVAAIVAMGILIA
jgi:hypothetical protein